MVKNYESNTEKNLFAVIYNPSRKILHVNAPIYRIVQKATVLRLIFNCKPMDLLVTFCLHIDQTLAISARYSGKCMDARGQVITAPKNNKGGISIVSSITFAGWVSP